MYFMYSIAQKKKKNQQEQKVIKINFFHCRGLQGSGAVAKMAGFGAIQGKVLPCLLAETWDNLVCGNGNGVDQGTSNGVTAKFICCSPHLLAPKRAFRPAEICSKNWNSSFTAGLFVLILKHVLLVALKINSDFTFPGTSDGFELVYDDIPVLDRPLIWPGMHFFQDVDSLWQQRFQTKGVVGTIHLITGHSITSVTHIL